MNYEKKCLKDIVMIMMLPLSVRFVFLFYITTPCTETLSTQFKAIITPSFPYMSDNKKDFSAILNSKPAIPMTISFK